MNTETTTLSDDGRSIAVVGSEIHTVIQRLEFYTYAIAHLNHDQRIPYEIERLQKLCSEQCRLYAETGVLGRIHDLVLTQVKAERAIIAATAALKRFDNPPSVWARIKMVFKGVPNA